MRRDLGESGKASMSRCTGTLARNTGDLGAWDRAGHSWEQPEAPSSQKESKIQIKIWRY